MENAAGAFDTPELLEGFRAGDRTAYDVLFKRYRLRLLSFIRKHCDRQLESQVSPEDLLQETHLEALRGLDGFVYRRELSYFLWTCGIAIRRIRHHCRRLSRQPPPVRFWRTAGCLGSSEEIVATLRSHAPDPEQEAWLGQQVEILAATVHRLPKIHREAILLRFIEGHDNATAASLAGVSSATFRPRVHRALEKLRAAIDRLLEGDGRA